MKLAKTLSAAVRELAAGIAANAAGCVRKICGADVELLNAIVGGNEPASAGKAAEALLRQFRRLHGPVSESNDDGSERAERFGGYDAQDRLRTWLPGNGGCGYIDLDHFELAIPEVGSARQAVAALHAMFGMTADAAQAVNAGLPNGQKLIVVANNSDGQGHSFGSHLNVLMRRDTYESMFDRRPQYLLYLAAFQVSSLVLTGAGKVGSENGLGLPYHISQRAEFFEELQGPQTTTRRPIVNTRNEPLCGNAGAWGASSPPDQWLARLHVIFYDNTLCHVSTFLRFGLMQIVVAMLEAGRVNPQLLLEDPLEAVRIVSGDPGLQARIRLADGTLITPVEHQRRFFDEAERFVRSGGCAGVVPDADEILEWWGRALDKLAAQDFGTLTRWLDWVLKLAIVESARVQHHLDWNAPELKQLDFQYANLEHGLYWIYEREGAVERLVSASAIERFRHQAPADTRAWTRAELLRRAPAGSIDHVDWDRVRFREDTAHHWPAWRRISLANPLGFTRADCQELFARNQNFAAALDCLEQLGDSGCAARTPGASGRGVSEPAAEQNSPPTASDPTDDSSTANQNQK